MKNSLLLLYKKPTEFIGEKNSPLSLWLIPLLGYYIITFVYVLFINTPELHGEPLVHILQVTFQQSFYKTLKAILVFGVFWIWLGSSIAGSKVPFTKTLQIVGCCLFFPGLLALLTIPLQLFFIVMESRERIFFTLYLFIMALPAVYAVVQLLKCIYLLNQRKLKKTVFVILWQILFLIIITFVLTSSFFITMIINKL